jgi:predicted AAA+ superfamily ATPase
MLEQGLRALPVVVVTGARQTGKSTLVRSLSPGRDRLYVTLDDLDVQEQAQKAPEDLVRRANRMTLDEVQRSPDLLRTIKRVVDQDREAGRFILTGSANLLMMRQVSESLAGRAVYLNLWPLTRRECAAGDSMFRVAGPGREHGCARGILAGTGPAGRVPDSVARDA